MAVLQRIYRASLQKALDHPTPTVLIALTLFIVSIFVFTRLGGVFIPQLEEGDIAMQMTLPTGSSLDESIRTSTQAEQILLRNFPEVRQVVSKIGTAEVPTDPMSVELADIMIVMKAREEWTSADTREELVAQMEEKLSAIIGASFDFTQPIQLRFNELMTGAKTDVAIKIYGEDMNVLHQKAVEAAAVVAGIEGAADVAVEQTEGLPQLLVQYNRQRIAQHGIPIEDLNTVIRTAFAGEQVGVVFEGERKFDLVVRLGEKMRTKFNLNSLFVKRSDGELIPLSELAEVQQTLGPAQISRDDTKRRVTIGINVRGRDVESIVNEAQRKLSQMDLPPGYNISYGGDFENLQKAKQRLTIAVPIALLLILILLYFAFGSFKYALLIFVAVPLSAIGGIFALWIRELPFSISAGVGFIALFGVAVLNGIVLISYFNDLKHTGRHTLEEIIVKGGLVRLRPVIMTASVAALGFLPMALSDTAGAEVQRPLATVVIGGLVSATLLTLLVLPVLYRAVERYSMRKSTTRISPAAIIGVIVTLSTPSFAQEPPRVLSEQDAVTVALKNSPRIKIAGLQLESQKSQQKTGFQLPSTTVGVQYGQINSAARDPFIELSQNLGSLPAHIQRSKVYRTQVRIAEEQQVLTVKDLRHQVRTSWQEWLYLRQVTKELHQQLSLYEHFEKRADLQYRLGESSLLEKTLTENSLYELRNKLTIESENLRQSMAQLKFLLGTDEDFVPEKDTLVSLIMPTDTSASEHPFVTIAEQSAARSEAQSKLERSLLFPEISVGYFRQNITETDIRLKGLQGWTLELAVPLWFRSQQGNIQRARIGNLQAREELALAKQRLSHARAQATSNVEKYERLLAYYQEQGLRQADAILRTATLQMEAGEIDFFQYLQSMQRFTITRLEYLQALRNYNLSIIELEYLSE